MFLYAHIRKTSKFWNTRSISSMFFAHELIRPYPAPNFKPRLIIWILIERLNHVFRAPDQVIWEAAQKGHLIIDIKKVANQDIRNRVTYNLIVCLKQWHSIKTTILKYRVDSYSTENMCIHKNHNFKTANYWYNGGRQSTEEIKELYLEGCDKTRLSIAQYSNFWRPSITIAASIVSNNTTNEASYKRWCLCVQAPTILLMQGKNK